MYNYIEILGRLYPDVEAETIPNGDPTNYDDVIFKVGSHTKAEIEAAEDASALVDTRRPIIDVANAPTDGPVVWDGEKFVIVQPVQMTQIPFSGNATVSNKWLSLFSGGNTSDTIPFLSPFNGSITGLSFVNSSSGSDCDLEIYKNGALALTIEIRNQLNYVDTSFTPLTIASSDTIGVFLRKFGNSKPSDPLVTLWFSANI